MSDSRSPSPLPSQWIDESDPAQPMLVVPARNNRWSYLLSGVVGAVLAVAAYHRYTAPAAAPVRVITNPAPPGSALAKTHSLQVHVVGCVQKPGVYTFAADARIYDAVQKAQPRRDANLEAINLAAYLEDGKQIVVPSKGRPVSTTTPMGRFSSSPTKSAEAPRPARRQAAASRTAGSAPVDPPARNDPPKSTLAPHSVDLNSASARELEILPGVGPALAQRIMEYREGHNGFGTVDELDEVKGIGAKKLEKIRPYVTVR